MLDSFLPLAKGIPSNLSSAALLAQAITATLSRWQAGQHGDRYGHARLLIPALAVAVLGMAVMMVLGSPVLIFAGMVLFGAGFGVIENATFALLIEQLPEAKGFGRLKPLDCGMAAQAEPPGVWMFRGSYLRRSNVRPICPATGSVSAPADDPAMASASSCCLGRSARAAPTGCSLMTSLWV